MNLANTRMVRQRFYASDYPFVETDVVPSRIPHSVGRTARVNQLTTIRRRMCVHGRPELQLRPDVFGELQLDPYNHVADFS